LESRVEHTFHRANMEYFTPTTTFAEAREATLRAAADLHGEGSTEQKTLAAAWSAVGVEGR
jgi:bacillolysin